MRRIFPFFLPLLVAPVCADEDPQLRAWRGERPNSEQASPADAAPDPIELEVGATSPLDSRLADLVAKGSWEELTLQLGEASSNPELANVLVRGVTSPVLVGAQEDARQRIHRLPQQALELYRMQSDPQAFTLLSTRGSRREQALREVLANYSATSSGPLAAQLLGERMLERGDAAGALLVWRRALLEQPNEKLTKRLMSLRAHLPSDQPGSLAPAPLVVRDWQVLWARRAPGGDRDLPRPIAADGNRVYLTDHAGILAVDRDLGLLKWRRPLNGDPREQRLALARNILLVMRPDRVTALRASDGDFLWEKRRNSGEGVDRYSDVAATPLGFLALAVVEGQRTVLGWNDAGQIRFKTQLWAPPERSTAFWVAPRRPPPQAAPDDDSYLPRRAPTTRAVVGDGRLVVLGDRAILTADGMVAALDLHDGGVVWLQDRCHGVEVNGERVLVSLAVNPFAVHTVTAAGQLLRLDPLTGRTLALPKLPEGVERQPMSRLWGESTPPEEMPYVLSTMPLVLLYRTPAGCILARGAKAIPVARLALGPLGPAAIHGGSLALPDQDGLVMFDLATGVETDLVEWSLHAGPVLSRGGLLVVAGAESVAVLAPLKKKPPKKELPPALASGPERWVKQLDVVDWRARLEAQKKLLSMGEEAFPYLRDALRKATTLDGRDQALELLTRLERHKLFREIAPRLSKSLLTDLVNGVNLAERLRVLRDYVAVRERSSPALREHLLEMRDPAAQYQMFQVLLRLDSRVRERTVALVCAEDEEEGLRDELSAALVEMAATNGPLRPLEDAINRSRKAASSILQATMNSQDRELLQRIWPLVQNVLGANAFPGLQPPRRERQLLLQALPRLVTR